MIPIEDTPPTARELRSKVAGLKGQLSNDARRGDHYAYQATEAEMRATKTELANAERREMNEAAAAARLKANRARAGMDETGSLLASTGYATPGDLIAARHDLGPVRFELERYLREGGQIPPSAA